MLYDEFMNLGGNLKSTVSKFAEIGSYNVSIGERSNILSGAICQIT